MDSFDWIRCVIVLRTLQVTILYQPKFDVGRDMSNKALFYFLVLLLFWNYLNTLTLLSCDHKLLIYVVSNFYLKKKNDGKLKIINGDLITIFNNLVNSI